MGLSAYNVVSPTLHPSIPTYCRSWGQGQGRMTGLVAVSAPHPDFPPSTPALCTRLSGRHLTLEGLSALTAA